MNQRTMSEGGNAKSLLQAAQAEKPHRLALYLPSQRKDGSLIGEGEEIADRMARLLCERFGGSTSYSAAGYFTGRSGIQKEPVRVLEFFCSPGKLEENLPFLDELAHRLKDELRQESVALSINGSLILLGDPTAAP